MNSAEVVVLAVKQFEGSGLKMLAPRIVERKTLSPTQSKRWDEDSKP